MILFFYLNTNFTLDSIEITLENKCAHELNIGRKKSQNNLSRFYFNVHSFFFLYRFPFLFLFYTEYIRRFFKHNVHSCAHVCRMRNLSSVVYSLNKTHTILFHSNETKHNQNVIIPSQPNVWHQCCHCVFFST